MKALIFCILIILIATLTPLNSQAQVSPPPELPGDPSPSVISSSEVSSSPQITASPEVTTAPTNSPSLTNSALPSDVPATAVPTPSSIPSPIPDITISPSPEPTNSSPSTQPTPSTDATMIPSSSPTNPDNNSSSNSGIGGSTTTDASSPTPSPTPVVTPSPSPIIQSRTVNTPKKLIDASYYNFIEAPLAALQGETTVKGFYIKNGLNPQSTTRLNVLGIILILIGLVIQQRNLHVIRRVQLPNFVRHHFSKIFHRGRML